MLEELMSSAQTEVAGQTNEEVQAEQTVETVEPTTTEEVTTEVPTISEIDINGQKVSLDEVRQGYIRQQDYIAKQQQLDAKLKEAEQSLQLVDYLRKNPQIAQRLYEDEKAPSVVQTVNPAMQEIENLKRELFQDKLNNTITNLKGKYSDFNEVEVMNKAVSMGVTDLEFVYNAMRGQNLDNIIAQRVKEELAKATEQINKNASATRTLVGSGQEPQATTTHNLLPQEMRVADMMGISYEEYAKYK